MSNQNGYAMPVALLMSTILLLAGTLAIHRANTEIKSATNETIYNYCFYAAEGGAVESSIWLVANFDKTNDPAWTGTFQGGFNNLTTYDVSVEHWLDKDDNVLLYGDEYGDYLWEINTTVGKPLEIATSTGTHPRGGQSTVEIRWQPLPPFVLPEAALWVHSNVNGNGVSGSIVGEGPSDDSLLGKAYYDSTYDCPAVPDIVYETLIHDIDYDGNTGEDYLEQQANGLYPVILLIDNLKSMADHVVTSISGNKLPADVDLTGQKIIYIDAGNVKLSQNITGNGILICNGDLEISGNLSWEGLILVNGSVTFNGGGAANSTMVTGSVIAVGDAVAINGSVDIIYDCNILNNLYDSYSSYSMISWRTL